MRRWIVTATVIAAVLSGSVGSAQTPVYDPTVHSEVVALLKQAKEMYQTAKKQLDRLNEVQRTLEEARQSYDTVVNTDLHALAKDLIPGQSLKGARGVEKIGALRAELERLEASGEGNVEYYRYQLSRLGNLDRLFLLQDASAKNVTKATTNLDERKSTQVIAQSTATLAALAAVEGQRREREEVQAAAAAKRDADLLAESAKIYHALGHGATR
jgi:hypothetical protein